MLVGEVEDEDVVSLSIDRLLDRVRLIGDEGRKESDMSHSGNDVVPVCVSKVEVGFFGEEEGGSQPVRREDLRQFTEKDLDKYSPDEVALVLQIDHEDSSTVDCVKDLFFSQRIGFVVE